MAHLVAPEIPQTTTTTTTLKIIIEIKPKKKLNKLI